MNDKSELSLLIERLKIGLSKNASYLSTIKYPKLLILSLQELNDLIGNEKVKDSVATQVSHLIMVKRRSMKNSGTKDEDVMLNTVLYGPPGVGKTLVGSKLAKIWYSLGYLDDSNNPNVKKREVGELLRDTLKDNGLGGGGDTTMVIYIMFLVLMISASIASVAWSFYNKFGGVYTLVAACTVVVFIAFVGYYISSILEEENSSKIEDSIKDNICDETTTNCKNNGSQLPADDQIIKILGRDDFVGKYVGWTAPNTKKVLTENLGKVVFVDEAYSLIEGPHDEFGMEALTAMNKFMSEHAGEIIIIFAGYKDLMEEGIFKMQPGLVRRMMWSFDCSGYNSSELFSIFKLQLKNKGWYLSDERKTYDLINDNYEVFSGYGGDTERAGFFARLEHSRDCMDPNINIKLDYLEPHHIKKGIDKLRENNINNKSSRNNESNNPLANVMRLLNSKTQQDSALDDLLVSGDKLNK
ncbi:MAG: hypothetical protein QM487_09935 [Candidatus Marithrix sp.]